MNKRKRCSAGKEAKKRISREINQFWFDGDWHHRFRFSMIRSIDRGSISCKNLRLYRLQEVPSWTASIPAPALPGAPWMTRPDRCSIIPPLSAIQNPYLLAEREGFLLVAHLLEKQKILGGWDLLRPERSSRRKQLLCQYINTHPYTSEIDLLLELCGVCLLLVLGCARRSLLLHYRRGGLFL